MADFFLTLIYHHMVVANFQRERRAFPIGQGIKDVNPFFHFLAFARVAPPLCVTNSSTKSRPVWTIIPSISTVESTEVAKDLHIVRLNNDVHILVAFKSCCYWYLPICVSIMKLQTKGEMKGTTSGTEIVMLKSTRVYQVKIENVLIIYIKPVHNYAYYSNRKTNYEVCN